MYNAGKTKTNVTNRKKRPAFAWDWGTGDSSHKMARGCFFWGNHSMLIVVVVTIDTDISSKSSNYILKIGIFYVNYSAMKLP